MKRSLRDPASRRSIVERLRRFTPDSPRKWGRMDHAQLMPHLAMALRSALGDLDRAGATRPARKRRPLFKYVAIHWLPWPEGRIKAPAGAFSTPSEGWDRDRELLIELMERFAVAAPETLGREHSMFGPMTARDWDVLQYRHLDHHLRQFSA
jgi:hypothetical protein